jgi:hypothetical protein
MIKIKLNQYLDSLNQNTVINCSRNGALYKLSTLINKIFNTFNSGKWVYSDDNLQSVYGLKYDDFFSVLLRSLDKEEEVSISHDIFSEKGIRSEILDTKSGDWVNGRVRAKINFELEFIPDETDLEVEVYESPLDEIRREIQQNG